MKIKSVKAVFIITTICFSSGVFSSIAGKYECVYSNDVKRQDLMETWVVKHVGGHNYTNDWEVRQANNRNKIQSGHSKWIVIGNKGISHWVKTADKSSDEVGVSEWSFDGDLVKGDEQMWRFAKNGGLEKELFSIACHKI